MAEMNIARACKILGVTEDISAQEIRLARRRLVRANHPDLLARYERSVADRRLSEINAAFDALIALKTTRAEDKIPETPGPHVTAAARRHAQRNAEAARAQAQARAHGQAQGQAHGQAQGQAHGQAHGQARADAQNQAQTAAQYAASPANADFCVPQTSQPAHGFAEPHSETGPAARTPRVATDHAQLRARRKFETALDAVSHPPPGYKRAEYV